jgi:hypothetical protein
MFVAIADSASLRQKLRELYYTPKCNNFLHVQPASEQHFFTFTSKLKSGRTHAISGETSGEDSKVTGFRDLDSN